MNLTLPSAKRALTPPGCRLRIATIPVSARCVQSAFDQFGVASIEAIGPCAIRAAAHHRPVSEFSLARAFWAALQSWTYLFRFPTATVIGMTMSWPEPWPVLAPEGQPTQL